MPDITMCPNQRCPSRHDCFRYMAVPSEHQQSYANFSPPIGKEQCKHVLEIPEGSTQVKKKGEMI